MGKPESKKSGGGKLFRTEIVTVRLDPRLRYLIDLAARKQRRTVSSYIEWMLEESLTNVCMRDADELYDLSISLADEKNSLWDVDEADRFAKLALKYPEMLNHHEQILWKLVRENGSLWRGRYGKTDEWQWETNMESFVFKSLRENWQKFNDVASGKADKDILPQWKHTNPDSDIPF